MMGILETDLSKFLARHFKFERVSSTNSNFVCVEGTLDVIDKNGNLFESYYIGIQINKFEYPNTIPIVIEKSNKIKRDWDYHVSKNGECCLDIPHELIEMKNRGIELNWFYSEKVYPFFANHQFREKYKVYANGEYAHFEDGIIQFYKEKFNISDVNHICDILKAALTYYNFPPNLKCPLCGQPKFKKCCRPIIYKLLSYGKQRLGMDYTIFKKMNSPDYQITPRI